MIVCLCGCDAGDKNQATSPSNDEGAAASNQRGDQPAPPEAPIRPWIVLSNFSLEKGGLTNKARVDYRFVQGRPVAGRKYYMIVDVDTSVMRSWVDEPVELEAAGGTLTIDVDGTMVGNQISTFIAASPRSTTRSDPEPEHLSGRLYLGQSESTSVPHKADEEPPAPKLERTAVLTNPRRERGESGELIAIDYQIQGLPEVAGFWLEFIGAEGGSVSYDVHEQVRAAPAAGTFRVDVPDPAVLESPYEVTLKCQPFGAATGASTDTVPISDVIRAE